MIEISLEKERVIKSLKELEKEYNQGNIPKSHYEFQKRKLKEQLETFDVADRVRRLQGKETADVTDVETNNEEENGELFKKFITPPGLERKNIKPKGKGKSMTTKIAAGVLIAAFFIGIVFGIYGFIPQQISSSSLYTNDSAFPPFVANNSTNVTNMTNTTNMTKNMTKSTNTTKTTTNKTTTKTKTKTNSTSTKKNSNSTAKAQDYTDLSQYF
ncbi:MAG TPA: hypothetical protein VHO92_08305 [Methanobacterium sp.]|nr:hypothetical protein [Methanobacterium sp.]